MAWTNPRTWLVGQLVTAAQMNTELRDNLQFLYDNRYAHPPGAVEDFAGPSAPTGWLMCDGTPVSRTTYAALFTAIGTTWGAGDGSTTFNVPDLRGRASIGAGAGGGLTARSLAGTGGEENHVLSVGELAVHTHDLGISTFTLSAGATQVAQTTSGSLRLSGTYGAGSGTGHNTMMPYRVLNKIIKT